jgi:hypothetical protein
LTLSDGIKWAEKLVIESNMIYQVSILKGLASVLSWESAATLTKNYLSKSGTNLMFEYPVASEVLVVVNGRTTSDAASSAPHDFTLTYAVGEQTKTIRTVFSIVSITPTSDDVYEYISGV